MQKQKSKIGRIVTGIVLAVMLLLAGALYWMNTRPDALEIGVKASLGQLEGKTNDEIIEALNRVVEEGTMNISINVNPTFAHGQAEGTLRIENSPANPYSQSVTITRDDTGEVIYESGLLPPNYHIQEDVLLMDLDAGDYPCTATFAALDADQNYIGEASAKITISVLG